MVLLHRIFSICFPGFANDSKQLFYVCFKEKDGTWTKPINLGDEVNSNLGEGCPIITPDGKYLFFTRDEDENGLSNIYWVSTEIIEKLRQ